MKHLLKSITSCFLIIVLLFSFISTVFAQNANTADKTNNESTNVFDKSMLKEKATASSTKPLHSNKPIISYEYIYSLDESKDFIYVLFEGTGYAIYSSSLELLEYNLNGDPPFDNSFEKKYYAGPMNYLYKINNEFYYVANNQKLTLSKEEIYSVSEQIRTTTIGNFNSKISITPSEYFDIQNSASQNRSSGSGDELIFTFPSSGVLIPNYKYFLAVPTIGRNYKNETYGDGNNSGTCGPVAAQLLLGYNNFYNDRRIIEDKYLNGYSDSDNAVVSPERNPNYCTDPTLLTSFTTGTRSESTGENSFYLKLISEIMSPNSDTSSNQQVKNGITSVLTENLSSSDFIIEKTGTLILPVDSSKIKSEIDSGRPVIINTLKILGHSNHYTVGYGYQDYTYPDGSGTYSGYIVHYGWQGADDTCVWINSSWCGAFISLKMNHDHDYAMVGMIPNTDRIEYKCTVCGQRTDSAITVEPNSRYTERVADISSGDFKEYYVTFKNSGNKLIQSFGPNDTIIDIYNDEYSLLATDDDSGYLANSLINFSAAANTPYIIRIYYYYPSASGEVKLSISPIAYDDYRYSDYDDFVRYTNSGVTHMYRNVPNTVEVITFRPEAQGEYEFATRYNGDTRVDTCLYLIDPSSTETFYFNDDGGGDLQAFLSVEMVRKPYYIVISTYNITLNSTEVLCLDIDPV